MTHTTLPLILAMLLAASAAAELKIPANDAVIKTVGGELRDPALNEPGWNLWSNGQLGDFVQIAEAGKYTVVVRAAGTPAAGDWPEMALSVDNRSLPACTVKGGKFQDYAFTVELAPGVHRLAVAFLNDGVVPVKPGSTVWKEDRNLYLSQVRIKSSAGAPGPARGDARAWRKEIEVREKEVLALADKEIERLRQADVLVRVVDAAGKAVSGAQVSAELRRHEFLFGCNIYMFDRFGSAKENDLYKQRFAELFNYATVGFYWRSYEPQRGKPDYAYTDKVVAWCQEHGIRMKGHPLLWGHEAGVPQWCNGQPAPEVQKQRVGEILGRYGGKIAAWEVVNEPAHLPDIRIDQPYRWARQADPNAYLIVNDYEVLGTGCVPFFDLLSKAKAAGVPFDGIGIQAHEPVGVRFPLNSVKEILDHYATLGKDLHITEFTPTSGGQKILGEDVEGAWDDAAQADYAVKFYRTCFGHKAVAAITWWDLCDAGAWQNGGGMLRKDLSPKPVYAALRRLIGQEWSTRATGRSDKDGSFSFRGFLGQYDVSVNGRRIDGDFRLTRTPDGKKQGWVLQLRE